MSEVSPVCVSIIIPAYNASATIGRTLDAILKQNCFQPFEIIVVDDGSTDNTAEIIRSFFRVKYVYQDNAGPAAARNHGAKLAQGEYLAFSDSDCVPHADWISLLMEGFRPQVGVVAGSYGIANPESWLARCIHKEILWRHNTLMPDYPRSFGSYNFCVRRDVFEGVGGFNTVYRHASGEDNDLSYKIIRSGWHIYFQRKAFVDHYHPTRVGKYLTEQFRHGFWRLKMYKDHPGMMAGDGYTFWKDMVEMPLSVGVLGAIVLSLFHYISFVDVILFLFIPFLVFEIICGLLMMRCFFEGILYGFIFLLRAFARLFGLSTGIPCFLFRKNKKIL